MAFFTLITVYCMHLIIRSQYRLCKRKKVGMLTYSEAMEYAIGTGPMKTRKLSKVGL